MTDTKTLFYILLAFLAVWWAGKSTAASSVPSTPPTSPSKGGCGCAQPLGSRIRTPVNPTVATSSTVIGPVGTRGSYCPPPAPGSSGSTSGGAANWHGLKTGATGPLTPPTARTAPWYPSSNYIADYTPATVQG